jgi:hypothetical protein
MIELRRIVLVNWHLLTRADLDLAGDAAILGQNRSGKSTIIDLIQAIMAGGSPRLFRFNRSAGEGGGRSDRTLAGYSLGQLNEDTFLRNEARSHIALVFEDAEGTRPAVSLGLSIEAVRGQPAEVVGHFIAEGARVDTSMLVEETGTSSRPAAWQAVRRRLDRECLSGGGQLHTPEDAKTFIREYMRALFTGRRTADPERFVRTFVAALSFTDITSVEQFVHRYLLEPKPIDIAELRESIQRYREIQKTIADLERRLEALRAIRIEVEEFARLLEEEETCRAVEKTALLVESLGALLINISEMRRKSADLKDTEDEFARLNSEIEQEEQNLEAVQRQIAATGAAGQRAVVEAEMREHDRDHAAVVDRLRDRYLAAARAIGLLELRDRLAVINPGELFRALDRVEESSRGLEPPDWPRDPAAMDRMLEQVSQAAASRIEKAKERRDDAIVWTQRLDEETAEDRRQLGAARSGQVSLHPATTRLMDALRREGMRPRTLCEVADVVDERWRNALEALLVRDREAVIVDPEHAYRATEILRHGRDTYPGCRVANTRRLENRSSTPEGGTLASMIRSEDKLAMAFVVFRIGNVRLAENQDALLSGGRAVMADGAYYDGLITEMRKVEGMKIGRAAAPLMEAALTSRIEERAALLKTHRDNERFFEDVIRRLEDCSRPVKEGATLDAIALSLDRLAEKRGDARRRLERISAQVDPQLIDAELRSKGLLASFKGEREDMIEMRGTLRAETDNVRKKLSAGESLPGSYLSLKQRTRQFRSGIHSLAHFRTVRERYSKHAGRPPARIASEMTRLADEAMEGHRTLDRDIRSALGLYAMNFPDALEGYAHAKITTAVRHWVEEGIAALEGNELLRYAEQANEAADRVSRLFKTTFVHELNSRFGELRAEMEKLSRALRARPLHGETYRLHELVKPDFEDLYHLTRDSETDESVLDALFGRAEPRDERHARALRQVEALLADDSFDFTLFQDYRSYFTYDLQMRDVATKRITSFDRRRGSASGAERQVPFYVVIGAALASAYHGSRQPGTGVEFGIGLAVFDEAFSKMDGPNQRTLLDFYRAIGLQVVIAAPTEKRAVVYENLDSIVDVFRSGDAALAESIIIKERVRDEMRAANPQHATDEELAARLSAESRAAE